MISAFFNFILSFVLLFILTAFYMLPSYLAHKRGHHQFYPILVLNVFLGWTGIGWVIALALAVMYLPQKTNA